MVTAAWIFGAAWMHITTGAVLTRYAQSLGMSGFGFGLLAALPFAGAFFQLPASYLMERFGCRKSMFLYTGLIHRLLWLPIAALPWISSEPHSGWWMLVLLMAFSHALANFCGPAWLTWMADLVPAKIRGRYFSRRGQYGRLIGAVVTVFVGWFLDQALSDGMYFQRIISCLLALAAFCGAMDILCHRTVPAAHHHHLHTNVRLRDLIGPPLRDPNFRKFLGFNFTLTFAIGYVGQFIWLYLFDVVGMSNLQANIMLVAVPLIASMLSFPIWGKLVDRLGCRPVLVIAGIFIVHGGASWILVTKESWWIGFMGSILAAMAWPGVELANTNVLLRMSQRRDGTSVHHGSGYVATHSIVVATAGVCSGIFGGTVAEVLADWHGTLFGWPLTYHGVLLLLSAGLRATSLLWLIRMHEPQAFSTRSALRYMVTNIYSNVQQAILSPMRGVARMRRATYEIPGTGHSRDGEPGR